MTISMDINIEGENFKGFTSGKELQATNDFLGE